MPRRFLLAVLLVLLSACPAAFAQEAPTYEIDSDHTRVTFFVDHLGFSKMPGFFNDIEGTIRFHPVDAAQAKVDVRINARGVTMGNKILDAKLRGPDYFNADRYPVIRFRGTRIEKTDMEEGRLTGMLTLLGVSRPVTLDVKFNRKAWNSYSNVDSIGFTATGSINRSEFGLKAMLPDVGNEVKLNISVEAYIPTAATMKKKQAAREKAAQERAQREEALKELAAKKTAEKEKQESQTPAAAAAPGSSLPLVLPGLKTGGLNANAGKEKTFMPIKRD